MSYYGSNPPEFYTDGQAIARGNTLNATSSVVPGHHNQSAQKTPTVVSAPPVSTNTATARSPPAPSEGGQMMPREDGDVGDTNDGPTPNQSRGSPRRKRVNRPGVRFGAKKRSWVWSWFVQDYNNANLAACDYCGRVIQRVDSDKGSPKKLHEHLRTHKLEKSTINYSRAVPIDGHGITYTAAGEPLTYPSRYKEDQTRGPAVAPEPPSASPPASTFRAEITPEEPVASPQAHHDQQPRPHYQQGSFPPTKARRTDHNYMEQRRFISAEFDNTPYSPMIFHRHVMKFLTDNKLPISVLKSPSFQQVVYTLRCDAVTDLEQLTSLYSSMLEVQNYQQPDG
ncbi:hypothetical protein DICA3_C19460 [Diutina catenulata]